MALIHVPLVEAPTMASRRPLIDEIDESIDLSDRRRVFLHVVLGLDVDADTAEAVFTAERRPTPRPERPAMSVENRYFTVEDSPSPTA